VLRSGATPLTEGEERRRQHRDAGDEGEDHAHAELAEEEDVEQCEERHRRGDWQEEHHDVGELMGPPEGRDAER
jgi:hypothetical protein